MQGTIILKKKKQNARRRNRYCVPRLWSGYLLFAKQVKRNLLIINSLQCFYLLLEILCQKMFFTKIRSLRRMLAANIKKLRKKLNLSQEQLAQKAGITYSTLIKIESGNNANPTQDTLTKLANVFKIKIDELVGR